MSYQPQQRLIEDVRKGRNDLGHMLFGIASVALVGQAAMVALALFLFGFFNAPSVSDPYAAFAATPAETISFLISFAAWAGVLALVVQRIHGRKLSSLLGNGFIPQFLAVFTALVLLQAVLLILPPWDSFQTLVPGLDFSTWLTILPLSLIAIFIQVSTEELIFRGYLQQHIAARFFSPVCWLVLPSVLFGLIHYDGQAGANAWWVVFTAILFGLIAADLTARTGSLGPAIALHLVNNVAAFLFVSLSGDLSGLALYTFSFDISNEAEIARLIPVEIALLAVSWLAARLALRR